MHLTTNSNQISKTIKIHKILDKTYKPKILND